MLKRLLVAGLFAMVGAPVLAGNFGPNKVMAEQTNQLILGLRDSGDINFQPDNDHKLIENDNGKEMLHKASQLLAAFNSNRIKPNADIIDALKAFLANKTKEQFQAFMRTLVQQSQVEEGESITEAMVLQAAEKAAGYKNIPTIVADMVYNVSLNNPFWFGSAVIAGTAITAVSVVYSLKTLLFGASQAACDEDDSDC